MYPGKNGENATSKKFKRDSSVNIVTDSKTDDSTSDSAPPLKTSNSTESTQAIDKIYKGWSQFATDAKYSDVTFEVGDRQFALHRLLLAKVSAKFTSMFDQKPAFGSVFKLVDISSNIFELILKFVYKGSLDLFVVSEQVEDLLIAADKVRLLNKSKIVNYNNLFSSTQSQN